MRVALLALMLWLTWTPLFAQTEREPKKAKPDRPQDQRAKERVPGDPPPKHGGHTVSKDSQPPKGKPSPAAKQQKQQFDTTRPQDQRARERVPGDPPPDHRKHTVSRDSQPPKGQPSPASQVQQKQAEQFQERQTPSPPPRQTPPPSPQRQTQQKRDDDRRTVQCTAAPVCGGGGYGSCQGVSQTYATASPSASRRDIVRQCVQANTPDTCRCAPQCERVAQCSIF